MQGPLTAADDDTDFNVDSLDFGVDGVQDEDVNVNSSPYGVDVSGAVADLSPVYDAAIQRLKAQRGGLSGRERLGALLIGFGQPTRHGKWQEGVSNAANVLFQQTLAQKAEDRKRRSELERLQNSRDIAGIRTKAQIEAANIRAAAAGARTGKLNADQTKRLGYARSLFPGKGDDELIPMLYGPKIDMLMMRPGVAAAAAGQGTDVGDALGNVERAIVPADIPAPKLPAGMTVAQVQQAALKAKSEGRDTSLIVDRMRKWGVPIPEGLR